MTHKEMTEIFAVMLLAYPNAEMFKGGIAKLGPTINLWVVCLPDIDFWQGKEAVVKLVRECKFPPTIAEFKEKAEAVKRELRSEIDMEWNWLRLDVAHGGKTPEAVFAKLPVDSRARRAIETMGGPDRLIVEGEHIYGDGRREKYTHYDFDGFSAAYEAVVRQTSALQGGQPPQIGQGPKQIGGKR